MIHEDVEYVAATSLASAFNSLAELDTAIEYADLECNYLEQLVKNHEDAGRGAVTHVFCSEAVRSCRGSFCYCRVLVSATLSQIAGHQDPLRAEPIPRLLRAERLQREGPL